MPDRKSIREIVSSSLDEYMEMYESFAGLPLKVRMQAAAGVVFIYIAPLVFTWVTFSGRIDGDLFRGMILVVAAATLTSMLESSSIIVPLSKRNHRWIMVSAALLGAGGGAYLALTVSSPDVVTEGLVTPLFFTWMIAYVLIIVGLQLTLRSTRKLYVEKARREADLRLAGEIQQQIIPQHIAEEDDYDVFAMTRPASEVGGDWFEVRDLPGGRILLAVGDVAGHGAGSGLLMAMAKGVLLTSARTGESLVEAVREVNRVIGMHASRRNFLTVAAVILDRHDRSFEAVRAGHLPIMIHRARSRKIEKLNPAGAALGLAEDPGLEAVSGTLGPGDLIAMVSDGVVESRDENEKELGLEAVAGRLSAAAAREQGKLLLRLLDVHGSGMRPVDDQTILLFRAVGAGVTDQGPEEGGAADREASETDEAVNREASGTDEPADHESSETDEPADHESSETDEAAANQAPAGADDAAIRSTE